MADGHGGYRRPSAPAPASGPGALSRRTDQAPKQLPDAQYGEQAAFQQIQQGAAMAGPGDRPQSPTPSGPLGSSGETLTPFGAASLRPDEPITTGAALGAGAGPEMLGLEQPGQMQVRDVQHIASMLPVIEFLGNLPDASPSTRAVVRYMKSILAGS